MNTKTIAPPEEYDGSIINDFTRYQIGYTTLAHKPNQERFRNMLHLVAYDITSPKRLRQIANICKDFGIRVEYSVFECDIDPDTFDRFWQLLANTIDEEADCILAYRICGTCVQKIESMGTVIRPGKILLYMP
jgi:CRISPR-associated protein Cas2